MACQCKECKAEHQLSHFEKVDNKTALVRVFDCGAAYTNKWVLVRPCGSEKPEL